MKAGAGEGGLGPSGGAPRRHERTAVLDPAGRGVRSKRAAPFTVSVVTCVYNEARNLPAFLRTVLDQSGESFALQRLVCVASGCTDESVAILEEAHRRDPRVRVIVEPTRNGKASALSRGLRAVDTDLALLTNADTLPTPGAFERLVRPFRDPDVGLACSRYLPVNVGAGVTTRLGALLWDLHDVVSQTVPKAAGAYAFRPRAHALPDDIEDDDTFLGILYGRATARSVYVRDSTFLLRVPERPAEFLGQRLRFNRQILGLHRRTGMLTSTWRPETMVRAVVEFVREDGRRVPLLMVLGAAEAATRTAALLTRFVSHKPLKAWSPVLSTKRAIEPPTPEAAERAMGHAETPLHPA